MSLEIRGGIPRSRRVAVSTTGSIYAHVPATTSKHLRLRNLSATANEIVRVYWTEADFTAGNDNYIELRAGEIFSEDVESVELWMQSENGTPDVEITVFQRRG